MVYMAKVVRGSFYKQNLSKSEIQNSKFKIEVTF
jgi:hypothetical protein